MDIFFMYRVMFSSVCRVTYAISCHGIDMSPSCNVTSLSLSYFKVFMFISRLIMVSPTYFYGMREYIFIFLRSLFNVFSLFCTLFFSRILGLGKGIHKKKLKCDRRLSSKKKFFFLIGKPLIYCIRMFGTLAQDMRPKLQGDQNFGNDKSVMSLIRTNKDCLFS
jgi:hypothetical protein